MLYMINTFIKASINSFISPFLESLNISEFANH